MDTTKFEIIKLGMHNAVELEKLVQVFHEVFEMQAQDPPKQAYLKKLLENKSFIVFVIKYNGVIVGGLTSYELPISYSEFSELYIYDLGIKSEFQRRGLGKLLIMELQKYCSNNNIQTFFVEAQEGDKHAVDFYHSVGGKSEKVFHFNFDVP